MVYNITINEGGKPMPKKTLFKKTSDYMERILSISPHQKSVECVERDDGVIEVTIEYYNKSIGSIEIANERELAALKREDRKQLKLGYIL